MTLVPLQSTPNATFLLVSTLVLASVGLSGCGAAAEDAQLGRVRQELTTAVFINEIHYDNTGTDAQEAIEIAGPAGTDLTGYRLVLYNGNGGALYDDDLLSGTIPSQDDGFGTLSFAYAVNGIQNGPPDAVALVDATGNVLQFLGYEGSFTAVGGPAAGLVSTDIGVSEAGSEALGLSLQLKGTGTSYEDFAWSPVSVASAGAVNGGQDFSGTVDISICGGPATFIHDIQGSGSASPSVGLPVTIEGVVVGDFQGSTGLSGFFVQEETAQADANPQTSEGIFVFQGSSGAAVATGDIVRLIATVGESFGLTRLASVTELQICAAGGSVPPTPVTLPVASAADLESVEGMLVSFSQTLYATETFTLGRFGEVALSANDRLFTPTSIVEPGAPAQAQQAANVLARIQLDDGSNVQNPPIPPYLAGDNTLRIGDTLQGLTGVLSFAFSAYEVHPVSPVSFERSNPRQATPPDPGGSLNVASFNVLNYFTTLDTGSGGCGPTGILDCRGANTASEFSRQREKILAALAAMNAT